MSRRSNHPTRTEVALVLIVAMLVGGCASTGRAGNFIDRLRMPDQKVRADLEELEDRVNHLEDEAAESAAEESVLHDRIAKLEQDLSEARAAFDKPPEPVPFDPPPPPRVQVLEVSDLPDDLSLPTEPAGPAPAAADGSAATGRELYDHALQTVMDHDYESAERGFQRYLRAHPDTDLSDNALYWIGECRFARNDVSGALDAFSQLLDDFPSSNKRADTLLKLGRALEQTGDADGARIRFEEVADRYPDSHAARLAAASLARLEDG